jgi:catechol 2,3-dioxygenase-like lactoylglutathione lyase family enzyme
MMTAAFSRFAPEVAMPQLSELAYFTDNVSGMTAFYQRLLGTAPVAQSPGMAIFRVGGAQVLIHKTYTPGPGDLPPENHVALAVPDVDAACAALAEQGLTVEIAPRDYDWGRSAYLRDPDGHLIEMNQTA